MALAWRAESKDRKDVILEGKTSTPEHKAILTKVKQTLVKAAEAGTANKGEKFKVSILNNGKVTDAWVMVAKPPRSAGKLLTKGKVSKTAPIVVKKAEKAVKSEKTVTKRIAKKATAEATPVQA